MKNDHFETKTTPKAIESENDLQLVVDSIYLAIRLLRNHIRDHKRLVISSEAGPNAARLAERIIEEIEKMEGKPIKNWDKEVAVDYIRALERHQSERVLKGMEHSHRPEKNVLEEMRRQNI